MAVSVGVGALRARLWAKIGATDRFVTLNIVLFGAGCTDFETEFLTIIAPEFRGPYLLLLAPVPKQGPMAGIASDQPQRQSCASPGSTPTRTTPKIARQLLRSPPGWRPERSWTETPTLHQGYVLAYRLRAGRPNSDKAEPSLANLGKFVCTNSVQLSPSLTDTMHATCMMPSRACGCQ